MKLIDDFSDERLIQEDTVSSLIQVKQLVVQLMNKANKIDEFLRVIQKISQENPSLPNKSPFRNISNRGEVTKEKIQNAVLRGTYTFEKVDKNLRGRALLIAKPANMNANLTEEEKSSKIMNEFVSQVDTAQEILNKEIVGTEKIFGTIEMRNLLAKFKEVLQLWKKVVDEAQEQHYYLTFFPARHILAFYDYFTSDFVNSKAELPSRKDRSGISRKNTDYSRTLKEIGEKLNTIFGKLLKASRELKVRGERIISDVVDRGKLCVASCNDKLRVPNIIMILICTKSTTIEELNIFIKRCFFAAKNGYRDKLFCIANLELLEFELQYGLVERLVSPSHIRSIFTGCSLTNGLNAETMKTIYYDLCSNVVCVSSDLSGQGKTEWIKQANFGSLVRQLRKCKLQPFESLHINIISADNSNEINIFLFELLTLGFVSSNVDIASFPQTSAFIEVASTVQQKLLNSLPITGYLVKEHL
ncbi:10299_t:CDS:10 [Gigaspora margarita]|uniref:10299_t:CDS:1 n=1 Tax=Gigaspora margarita TaxID=4874 RepID=A0ABN7UME0_GIGMA|nr:10299_t:CDS:10 [Gigaspora margarita]